MTGDPRLHHAERLLTGPVAVGVWARGATWLIRLALENALDRLWLARRPELVHCSMRAQLLALAKYRDQETARRVAELWHTLSSAAHHHPYELAPSAQEVHGWLVEARELVSELAG